MNLDSIDDAYPLSHVQQGMLFHCLQSESTQTYVSHICFNLEADQELDNRAWQAAWHKTILGHDALRASFIWDGIDTPVQVIQKSIDPEWTWIDLRGSSKETQLVELSNRLALESETGIDLSQSPLMRFAMLRLSETDWHVIWSIHHLLADGWSTPLILQHVIDNYDASQTDHTPAPKYADYIAWQNSRSKKEARDWWNATLDEVKATPLRLPPPSSLTKSTVIPKTSITLDEHKSSIINEFCTKHAVTLSTLVHATWGMTVAAYADTNIPLFGTTVSGRHPEQKDSSNTVGLFLNTLPLPVRLNPDQAIQELLHQVQLTMASCNQHDCISLTELNELIESSDAASPLESIVVMESHCNDLSFTDSQNSLRIDSIDYSTHSNYPLALLAYPGNELQFNLIYDDQLFSNNSCTQLLSYFSKQLDIIVTAPGIRVADCFDTATACTTPEPYQARDFSTIDQWISQTAAKTPDATAVICGDQSITYQQLETISTGIAEQILTQVGHAHSGVGLYLPRSVEQIVAMIAIMKSGCFYVPLDVEAPEQRTMELVRIAGINVVLQRNTHNSLRSEHLILLDYQELYQRCAEHQTATHSVNTPEATAYVIFTSGSTGVPKGVPVSHGNLLYSTASRFSYYSEHLTSFLLLSSISFDSSVAGIYWSLCSGATLLMPKQDEEKELHVIADIISTQNVSHTLCLPSLYKLLLEHCDSETLSSLRAVVVAGETCTQDVIRNHFNALPNTSLYNEYGPSEATVWSTVHPISPDDINPVPIGKPIPGTQIRLTTESARRCPDGAVGEIEICSPGVVDGYAGIDSPQSPFTRVDAEQPSDSTRNAYKTGDLGFKDVNDNLIYLGRKDRQLKIRGHRIEPGEIEAVMQSHPTVIEAAVIAVQKSSVTSSDQAIINALKRLPSNAADSMLKEAEDLHREAKDSIR